MSGPYTLAHIGIVTGEGPPDVEFPSIRALAAYVVGHRAGQACGPDGRAPEIVLRAARVEGRQGLEGACIAVRLQATGAAWPGQLVGYAYLPDHRASFITPAALQALMAAILVEEDASAARRAATLEAA